MNTFRRAATLALSFALVIALAMKVDAYQLITNSMISPTAGISLTKLTAPAAGVMVSDGGTIGTSGLGTAGQFLTTAGGAIGWGTPASGGGWQTAIDCDFTAEATHNFPNDVTYTICGKSWNVEGTPGAISSRSTIDLTNGSGLVLTTPAASGGSAYGGVSGTATTNREAPLVWLPLSQLAISGLDWSSTLRVSIYVTSQSLSATDGAMLFWGVDNDTPAIGFGGGSTWYSIICDRETASSLPTYGANVQTGGLTTRDGTIAQAPAATWSANVSTSRCEFRLSLLYGQLARVDTSGAYSGAWPTGWTPWVAYSTAVSGGQGNGVYLGWANLDAGGGANQSPSDALGVVLGLAYPGAFGHGSNATIARLRVEYLL